MNALELGVAALSAVFAAGGAWAAVRLELRYLRGSVKQLQRETERAHERIDQVVLRG